MFDQLHHSSVGDQHWHADASGVRHLEPLYQFARGAWCLTPRLRMAHDGGAACPVPQFTLRGDAGGHESLRVGIFAGFAKDQFDTVEALARVLLRFGARPLEIDGLHITAFPLVNRTVLQHHFGDAPGLSRGHLHGSEPFAPGTTETPVEVLITLTTTPGLDRLTARVDRLRLAKEVVEPALRVASEQLGVQASTHVTRASASLGEIAAAMGLPAHADAAEIHLHAPSPAHYAARVETLVLALSGIFHRLAVGGANALQAD